MGESLPLRILHISDLHFSANGAPPAPAAIKASIPGAVGFLQESTERRFLRDLNTHLLKDQPEDRWPKAVIVTGDVVEQGGAAKGEFENAATFLLELANQLRIPPERICVVPGNHDVNWTRGLDRNARFAKFLESMSKFTTPHVTDGHLTPQWVNLGGIRQSIKIKLLLLTSPTFSGIEDPFERAFAEALQKYVPHFSPEESASLQEVLRERGGLLDIAALGAHQLQFLAEPDTSDDTIRVAVLHHHLLPDPQIEVAQFEAVLDSGKVLDSLIRHRFDLVLTGHKHNRRLVHYRRGQQSLDVYTAPSLFKHEHGRAAGFTVINVHGTEHAAYATLDYYDTETFTSTTCAELVRHGRVHASIARVCAEIPPRIQKRVVPHLKASRDVFQWSPQHKAAPLVEQVWKQLTKDLRKLGEQRLIFRPPQLINYWTQLIAMAAGEPPETRTLRLVSSNDLAYWEQAAAPYATDAKRYEEPIRSFRGTKSRILLLNEHVFRYVDEARRANGVIERMVNDGIHVLVFEDYHKDNEILSDFGIIGDFAVSRFASPRGLGDEARALEQSFNHDDLVRARRDWDYLVQNSDWRSDGPSPHFTAWLQQKHELVI